MIWPVGVIMWVWLMQLENYERNYFRAILQPIVDRREVIHFGPATQYLAFRSSNRVYDGRSDILSCRVDNEYC
ncbi:hypothetical protein A3195_09940 [Candidatus Thiodiazotropha endoloripes]|uniref:Uncharacterized protein n=1 Tax=Candidatus Thiodiazotropha endoloripes TaxID=1818881 RepID=A0A1E2UQY3_9GAMM|nr:hypothetical protein A3195_09940 [Candidatus Thiodiazotropha endoloripes]ODB97101.1 hypothetical protein A3196_10190 [Candidatus Thiodiazotropha endoloripes]